MVKYDLIIVGGGIAGLRVAIEAKKINKELKIIVLEKYDELGGRMRTIHKKLNGKMYQYECGAGRICANHYKLLSLIKHYNLHTTPLSSRTDWRKYGNTISEPNNFEELWYNMCLEFSMLPTETLRSKTLRDLAIETLGTNLATQILETYPYRAEIEIASAESSIDLYLSLSNHGYKILNEGFTALIEKMAQDSKKMGVIFKNDIVINHVDLKDNTYTVSGTNNAKTALKVFEASRVVLAVDRNALEHIHPFSSDNPLIKSVRMEPLLRIYSIYKDGSWFPEHKVVTNSSLRYIIPINKSNGLIMSSYLDSRDIELWTDLYKKAKRHELIDNIHNETTALFPEKTISDKPIYISPEYWHDGCSYWLTGTDYKSLTKKALQPFPHEYPNLHLVGESFSTKQQWIEGALEHADSLIDLLKVHLVPS